MHHKQATVRVKISKRQMRQLTSIKYRLGICTFYNIGKTNWSYNKCSNETVIYHALAILNKGICTVDLGDMSQRDSLSVDIQYMLTAFTGRTQRRTSGFYHLIAD